MPKQKPHTSSKLEIYGASVDTKLELPLLAFGISAGFPSPALDFLDLTIDLNKHIVKRPVSTFFGRVKGESMKDAGINDDDLLVIDKSLEAVNGKIAVCYIDGEFTLKRIKLDNNGCWLMPANDNYKPIPITENNDLRIWGIVTHVIKAF